MHGHRTSNEGITDITFERCQPASLIWPYSPGQGCIIVYHVTNPGRTGLMLRYIAVLQGADQYRLKTTPFILAWFQFQSLLLKSISNKLSEIMVENSFFIGSEWWNRTKYLTWLSRAKRQLQRWQSGCPSGKCEWIVVIEHFCQLGWAHWSQELDLILKKKKKMNWLHCKKNPPW